MKITKLIHMFSCNIRFAFIKYLTYIIIFLKKENFVYLCERLFFYDFLFLLLLCAYVKFVFFGTY